MCDGVLENYTGAMLRPYCDAAGHETDQTASRTSIANRSRPRSRWTREASRSTCTRSAIGRSATPRRVRGGPRRERGPGPVTTSPTSMIHPDDVPGSASSASWRTASPTGPSTTRRWTSSRSRSWGRSGPLQYPFATLHARRGRARVRLRLVGLDREPARGDGGRDPRADPSTRRPVVPPRPARAPPRGPRRVHEGCILRQPRRRGRLDRRGNRADLVVLDRTSSTSPTPRGGRPRGAHDRRRSRGLLTLLSPLVARTGPVRQTPTVGPPGRCRRAC